MATYEAWRIICCSNYMSDELRRIFSLPQDKIDVIPNGIDQVVAPDKGFANEVKSHYAQPGDFWCSMSVDLSMKKAFMCSFLLFPRSWKKSEMSNLS